MSAIERAIHNKQKQLYKKERIYNEDIHRHKRNTRNGVGVGHFQAKSALTYLQTPTHEISLFASLNTLNDFFPIISLSANFNCF